jgi:hypothetical protein
MFSLFCTYFSFIGCTYLVFRLGERVPSLQPFRTGCICKDACAREDIVLAPRRITKSNRRCPPRFLVARGCAKMMTLKWLLCQPLGVSLGRIGTIPQPSGSEGMCENANAREASMPAPRRIAGSNRRRPSNLLVARGCAKMLMLERLLC